MAYHFLLFTANGRFLLPFMGSLMIHHLNYELPVLVLLLSWTSEPLPDFSKPSMQFALSRPAPFQILPCRKCLPSTADDFHLIHGFHKHSQIFFNKCGSMMEPLMPIQNRTNLQIRFTPLRVATATAALPKRSSFSTNIPPGYPLRPHPEHHVRKYRMPEVPSAHG